MWSLKTDAEFGSQRPRTKAKMLDIQCRINPAFHGNDPTYCRYVDIFRRSGGSAKQVQPTNNYQTHHDVKIKPESVGVKGQPFDKLPATLRQVQGKLVLDRQTGSSKR